MSDQQQQQPLPPAGAAGVANRAGAPGMKNGGFAAPATGVLSSQYRRDVGHTGFAQARSPLARVRDVDRILPKVANLALGCYFVLLAAVYGTTPRGEWQRLHVSEQSAAFLGLCCLAFCCLIMLVPAALQRRIVKENMTSNAGMSGIVYAAVVVQMVSMMTNFNLAFLPTIVRYDPYAQSRVFLIRWCEFIPLAGLMTFLCEAIDLPKDGLTTAAVISISEAAACIAGIALPLSGTLTVWRTIIVLSFAMYIPIFFRLYKKHALYKSTPPGRSFIQQENFERIYLSYKLMIQCCWVWTAFVVLYFTNLYVHCYLPEDHWLQVDSLAMIVDTLLDVTAKAVYMIVIVQVHYKLEHHHW